MVREDMRRFDPENREEAVAANAASVFLAKLSGTYEVAEAIMFGSRARRSPSGQRP
jgi:predicted nucleotidyltransferase